MLTFQINYKLGVLQNEMGYIPSIENCKKLREYLNKTIRRGKDWINKENLLTDKWWDDEMRGLHDKKVSEEKPKPTGYIYIASDSTHNYLKIGFSTKPDKREITLQAEKPTIQIIYQKEGKKAQEKEIHLLLKDKRIRGEWFNITLEQAKESIEKIINI